MNSVADQIVKKVIAAYPIELTLTKEGQAPQKANIVKMTEIGFLMKTESVQFTVAEDYQLQFTLPMQDKVITAMGKVIKTYDAFDIVGKQKTKVHTVEIHFIDLSQTHREMLNRYLVQSNQRKEVQ